MLIELAQLIKLVLTIVDYRNDGVPYATIDAELGLDNRTPNSAYRIMKTRVARFIVESYGC